MVPLGARGLYIIWGELNFTLFCVLERKELYEKKIIEIMYDIRDNFHCVYHIKSW